MSADADTIVRKQNALGVFVMQHKGHLLTNEVDGVHTISVKVGNVMVEAADENHEAALDSVAEKLSKIIEEGKSRDQ